MSNALAAQTSRRAAFAATHAAAVLEEIALDAPALSEIGRIVRFARNAAIFSEYDEARYSYKVIRGAIRLSKILPDGRRQIAKFLLPGDMFALDCDDEHSLTAEALTEVTVVCYPRIRLERLSEDVPEVRRVLMSSLRRELSAAQNHVVMLGRQTAKERVASFLLSLASRGERENSGRVEFPMSRQDIADYLGLTIETVCRALTELKKLDVIAAAERHHVVIRNHSALRSIATGGE